MHTPSTLPRKRNRSTWSLTVALAMAAALLLSATPAAAVHGTEIWVDGASSGTDAATGAQNKPFRTINEAIDHLGPASATIWVLPAVYVENVILRDGQILAGRLSSGPVTGRNQWNGLIQGTVKVQGDDVQVIGLAFAAPPVDRSSWNAVLVEHRRPAAAGASTQDVVVKWTRFTGSGNGSTSGAPATLQTRALQTSADAAAAVPINLTFENNEITGMEFGVYVNPGAGGTLKSNVITRTQGVAVGLNPTTAVTLVDNTITDNAGAGITVDRFPAGSTMRKNKFGRNGASSVYAVPGVSVDARRNWWGNGTGPRIVTPSSPDVNDPNDPARETARVNGAIAIDPWCREVACTTSWVTLKGKVSRLAAAGGGGVGGATVAVEGSGVTPTPVTTTTSSGDVGAYSLSFPVDGVSSVTVRVTTPAYCVPVTASIPLTESGFVEAVFPPPTAPSGLSFLVFDQAAAANKLDAQFTVARAGHLTVTGSTGSDGACDLLLENGSYTVSVSADRYLPNGPLTATVPRSGTFDVPLAYDEALATIKGSVQRGGTDTPIGGAIVTATAAGETTKTVSSVADGSFALQLTPDKDWTLSAAASGYHPSTLAAIKPGRHEQRGGVRILMLTDRSGGGDTGTVAPRPTPTPTPAPVTPPGGSQPLPDNKGERVSGSDRAGTAVAVSMSTFDPGTPVVYVATSGGFADALAGGPAAARQGGPILLVERDRVPDSTLAELRRLAPQRVVVLGGSGVVSDGVAAQLDAELPVVDRVSGSDRFATAAAVSRATFPVGPPVAYIATGAGFADALSGGAAAAHGRGPVLLVDGGVIPAPTSEELRRLAPRRIVVLGGESAVPPAVLAELGAYTEGTVQRLSGPDRYATSAAIADATFQPGVDTVYVATGENFPDALAGVPAAGRERAPLLLVQRDAVPEPVAAQLRRLSPRRIVILGGSGAVSPQTEHTLASFATG